MERFTTTSARAAAPKPLLPGLLLLLFALRVLGQLLVRFDAAPFLPPMSAWQSGLLPYGLLLAFQIALLAAGLKILFDLSAGRGLFSAPRPRLARGLSIFAGIYAGGMVARYILVMTFLPDQRWFGGAIPIAFHFILAGFLYVIGRRLQGERA